MSQEGVKSDRDGSGMTMWRGSALLIAGTVLLSACTTTVRVNEEFPDVVAQPRDLTVTLVMDHAFQNYVAQPTKKDRIHLGAAQVELFPKAFRGLFTEVKVVGSKGQVGPDTDMVIVPTVREVQLSAPSESYLNVYEVWIKYSLDIQSADGVPIDSWFLPAYGKTPYSYLLSRSRAVEEASVMALRDVGAKLMLDFYRIPAVYGWVQEYQSTEVKR